MGEYYTIKTTSRSKDIAAFCIFRLIFGPHFGILFLRMFGILGRLRGKKSGPVVIARPDHCISRKNIDPDALKVLYRLNDFGDKAYLGGGGVRDLLLGRAPKDFDVGTDALPRDIKKIFRNCFLIGKRFRLAQIRFGPHKVIETTTFRSASQTVGEIIEHAAEGPLEDNTFGTPETDANRRDFTVNGLFYDIKTFAVIDHVGGMKDLKKKLIRSIGDPMIRFREDPVRMMRAIKFSARLGFAIEKKTEAAIRELHSCILTAAVPRVCEEVFRLFTFGESEKAFRMMWRYGLMGDLLPGLAKFIAEDGGDKSRTWKYLSVLDRYERAMHERDIDVSNGLRAAVLYTAMAQKMPTREALGDIHRGIKMPKMAYFAAAAMIDSRRRLAHPPERGKLKLLSHRDFPDMLDYNRIVARAESRSEKVLDQWAALYKEKGDKNHER